jgi:hypothetical protein
MQNTTNCQFTNEMKEALVTNEMKEALVRSISPMKQQLN